MNYFLRDGGVKLNFQSFTIHIQAEEVAFVQAFLPSVHTHSSFQNQFDMLY